MPQKSLSQVLVSDRVKAELTRRKVILSRKLGRTVSYDYVVKTALGM